MRLAGGSWYGSDDESAVEGLEATLNKLAGDAANVRDSGYSVGVDTAGVLGWTQLETLEPASKIRAELVRWARDEVCDLPDTLTEALDDYIGQYDLRTDEHPVPVSPTFYEGVADALVDVYEAVRRRLNGMLPKPLGSSDEEAK